MLAAERADGTRVVTQTEHWTAFVPHAARWPYEVHLYPHRRVPDLASLDALERKELAEVELDIFGRFARLFDAPAPYIAGWHQAPVRDGREHLRAAPGAVHLAPHQRQAQVPGRLESGMDAFASDVMPEAAAARLRELAP